MDVLNPSEEVILKDVEVKHTIAVPGYAGRTTSIVVFMDSKANTYYWVTATYPGFEEGEICDIKAKCDRTRRNRLSFVKKLFTPHKDIGSVKSEQPDAKDVLLGLANYK